MIIGCLFLAAATFFIVVFSGLLIKQKTSIRSKAAGEYDGYVAPFAEVNPENAQSEPPETAPEILDSQQPATVETVTPAAPLMHGEMSELAN